MASKNSGLDTSIDVLFDKGAKQLYSDYIVSKYPSMAVSTVFRYAVQDLIDGMDDDAVMECDFEYIPSFMIDFVKKPDASQKDYHRANYDILRIRVSGEMKESLKEHAEYMEMDMSHFVFAAVHRFFYLYADVTAWYGSRKNIIVFDEDSWVDRISREEGISVEQALELINNSGTSNIITGKPSEEIVLLIKRMCISRCMSVDEAMDMMGLNEEEKKIYVNINI